MISSKFLFILIALFNVFYLMIYISEQSSFCFEYIRTIWQRTGVSVLIFTNGGCIIIYMRTHILYHALSLFLRRIRRKTKYSTKLKKFINAANQVGQRKPTAAGLVVPSTCGSTTLPWAQRFNPGATFVKKSETTEIFIKKKKKWDNGKGTGWLDWYWHARIYIYILCPGTVRTCIFILMNILIMLIIEDKVFFDYYNVHFDDVWDKIIFGLTKGPTTCNFFNILVKCG